MAKNTFSVRLNDRTTLLYRAIATVKNVSNDVLLEEMLANQKEELSETESQAVNALLAVWKEKNK